MRISELDFDLPERLIAQEPAPVRDASRLLVLHRDTGAVEHRRFSEIAAYLGDGDVIVLNDTKVVRSRLFVRRATGGRIELLLFRDPDDGCLVAMVRGSVRDGERLTGGGFGVTVGRHRPPLFREVAFDGADYDTIVTAAAVPLPPYIRRDATERDVERYQTVFARHDGAIAAPTASLHFTGHLLDRLRQAGVRIVTVTLHVGPGTFLPVKTEHAEDHRMLPERYTISQEAADAINDALAAGRAVLPCGTTVVRSLESASEMGRVVAGSGVTDIFIHPGYRFRVTRHMLTNFHVPRSTPLLMAATLAGREPLLAAYREAVAREYRFYSYGDAMMIW